MSAILYYFYDPMCSWCYAFQPAWENIKSALPTEVELSYVLGGLAADEELPMSAAMQRSIQQHWQRIQQVVPGTEFNFDFWSTCTPRRSTWPACRAVIAAGMQDSNKREAMLRAIQRAYYREARNPSDDSTLLELARELGLDEEKFKRDLNSAETGQELQRQVQLGRSFNVAGFPSLVLDTGRQKQVLNIDYNNAGPVLESIRSAL